MPDQISAEQAFQMGQEEQAQANDPNGLYADHMREEKVANVISQLDPSSLLNEVAERLRGKTKSYITGEWEFLNKDQKPVSEEMVSKFVSFLGSVLNQNTTLSNYSAHEINMRMEMIIDYIRDDLSDNDEKYGIKGDYTEMTRIGLIICETISSVFRRALNGMESKRIFSSLRVNESLTQAPKRSPMDALKFW